LKIYHLATLAANLLAKDVHDIVCNTCKIKQLKIKQNKIVYSNEILLPSVSGDLFITYVKARPFQSLQKYFLLKETT
jgi:hypothetical protein